MSISRPIHERSCRQIRIVTVQEIIEEQKRLDILLSLEVLKSAEKQMEVTEKQTILEFSVSG